MFSIGVDNEKALELDNKANFLILSSIFKDFLHLVLDFLLKKKKVTVGGKNHYYSTNALPSLFYHTFSNSSRLGVTCLIHVCAFDHGTPF